MMSPLDSAVFDSNCESIGFPVSELMNNAGVALAEEIVKTGCNKILIICGSGNNGGDGYVAAKKYGKADVCAFRKPKSNLCKKASKGITVIEYSKELLNKYDLIVDCVLGVGVSGDLKKEYLQYIDDVNSSSTSVLSCDVPTGFGTEKCVKADVTVTFHDVKEGMGEECGTVIVTDIGIPSEACDIVGIGDYLRYPIPKENSHKGSNGRVLIVGGGPYVGAPALSGMAALRTGADLVTIYTPESSYLQISSFSPCLIVKKMSGSFLNSTSVDDIIESSKNVDVLLIGPGLGTNSETAKAVIKILEGIEIPAVVDADGITCCSSKMPKKSNILFTPHSKECDTLLKTMDAEEFCKKYECTILKKGKEDRIVSSDGVRINKTGCAAMTVGGTGDVLAGIVSSLIAKGLSLKDAAALGSHISGKAGEFAFQKKSYGLLPTDVIDCIPEVLKEYVK